MNENQNYRDELAQEVKNAPKDERRTIINEAKNDPQYWHAAEEHHEQMRASEELIDDGFGVLISNKILFHGSNVEDISDFDKAENTTIGDGAYFSDAKNAIYYSRERTKNRGGEPVIYEVRIENLKFIDLRNIKNQKKFFSGQIERLSGLADNSEPSKWQPQQQAMRFLDEIQNLLKDKGGNPVTLMRSDPEGMTRYAKSLGYDGLIAFEAGEHDNETRTNYLIFEPEKLSITETHKII